MALFARLRDALLRADPRLRHWGRALAVASLIHLTLPDIRQPGWWLPGLIEAIGALWLLRRPAVTAFALCAVGTAWPLLLLRDVLTQSLYLTLVALIGAAGTATRRASTALAAVRLITAGTYALAAFHKLNRDFFDPAISCATHAVDVIAARYNLLAPLVDAGHLLPLAAVATELALAFAVWRGARWMWPLGIVFHLPLTVTLAPAFFAVMFSGYAAATPPRDVLRWRRALRGSGPMIALGIILGGAVDALAAGGVPDGRAWVAAMGFGGISALTVRFLRDRRGRPRAPRPATWPARALALGWLLHGLTPYLGWQVQHCAAMLSNLRIDAGCHNSLIMPEALRGEDPYIRIEHARIGPPGARPERERTIESTLWHVAALHAMRANWCVPELRPIAFIGTWNGRPFALADLCADDWLAALPGAERWPSGFQAFQKNLPRECARACIH
ncbi:MAG: hypothetical protein KC620_21670 [Myxococcales bacterium]|nr:hypothetical protein [Myxococcales bacterium]